MFFFNDPATTEIYTLSLHDALPIFTAGLGAVLLGAFVAHERRASAPLVRLQIISRRAVAIPNAAIVLKSMVGAAQLYVLTLYFQDALGRTPLEAGLLFIPMTLASVVAS